MSNALPSTLGELEASGYTHRSVKDEMRQNLVTKLKAGDVRVELESGEQQFFFITGGLLEVQPHLVTVLSDTALRGDDLDEDAAQAAMKQAEERLKDKSMEDKDYQDMKAELAAYAAQIRAIEKLKKLRS